ncbi:MAG: lipopolysaccharide assembly protein LapA domain-containing protein [Desulfobacterales bacterium]
MKKFKIVLALLIAAFIGILVFQNQAFFLARQSLALDLWVTEPYTTPETYIVILFLVSFVVGLLIAYFFGLFDQFRKNKLIRQQRATIETQQKEISTLKTELEATRQAAASTIEPSGEEDLVAAEATRRLEDVAGSAT